MSALNEHNLPPTRPQSRWRRYRRPAGWLLIAACALFMARRFTGSGDMLAETAVRVGPLSVLAILCFVVGHLFTGTITHTLTRAFGGHPRWVDVLRIHLTAQLAKYLPAGNVLHVTAQTVALGRLPGVGLFSAGSAVMLMCALACAGAAFTYGATQLLVDAGLPNWKLVLPIVSLPLVALLAVNPFPWPATVRTWLERLGMQLPAGFAWSRALALTLLSMAAWLAFGVGAGLLAVDLLEVSSRQAVLVAGAFALSWLLGFLAVITPGGLGVREVSLMLLLEPLLPPPWPALYPVASRLAWVVADTCNLLVGWAMVARWGTLSDPGSDRAAEPIAGQSDTGARIADAERTHHQQEVIAP